MDEEDPFYDHNDLQPETKHSTKKKAGRTKSTDNVRVVEMRKERSRNAARNRRGKENAQFDELAKLLPLPAAITSQLDKASIIRLTISYLNMREFSGIVPQKQLTDGETTLSPLPETTADTSPTDLPAATSTEIVPFKKHEGPEAEAIPQSDQTGTQLLHALEGFLLVLSEDGKILYVSETVSINLGLSQVELTGANVYNYVHVEDHADLMDQLRQASSSSTGGVPFQDSQGFFSCQQNDEGSSLFDQGDVIGPGTLPLHQPRAFFLRMKCTLVRRGGSYAKSSGFKVVHCVGRIKNYATDQNESPRKAFVMLAQPVPTMNINELPLECNMFVSRVNMDLKIVYCEGRIHKFMDYLAKDIVGISAYDFYHAGDVALIQGHHAKFLSKGQVWTKYYRWMNKNGGWVWMQTKASLIPHPTNPGLKQMLCLNYILSDVEHRSVVLGMAQLKGKPELDSGGQLLSELPSEADTTGELKDALIDDQVMVFPKWHATSDKLVPEQTLLDHMALQRAGYNTHMDETIKTWTNQHNLLDQPIDNESSPENDIDDKDLQDIVDIIDADMTSFDRSLIDFVVSGNTQFFSQTQPSQLGPLGAYIEEIPDSSTEPVSVNNLVVPKVEEEVLQSDMDSLSFCSQVGRNASVFSKDGPSKRPATGTPYTYGTTSFDTTIPNKIPRLSHMQCVTVSGPKMYNKSAGRSTATITVLPDTQNTSDPYQMSSTSTEQSTRPYVSSSTATSTSTSTKPNVPYVHGSEQNFIGLGDDRRVAPPPVKTSPNSYQNKPKTTAVTSRKPKTLLEQLNMMPTKDNDIFNDDLMFDIVEELLEESSDNNEMTRNAQGFGSGFDTSTSDLTTLIPRQEIKQEVVTPTSTETQLPFSDCFQNMLNRSNECQMKSPTGGRYRRSDKFSSGLENLKVEVPVCMPNVALSKEASEAHGNGCIDTRSPYVPSSPQLQWGVQQQQQQQQRQQQQQQQLLRQSSWPKQPQQQQQQRTPLPYQLQGTKPQTVSQSSFSQQQADFQQQKLQQQKQQQYELLRSQQQLNEQQRQQKRPRQQMTPSSSTSTTSYTQQSILRELNDLIQKNNNIQSAPNFVSPQSLTISSGPLPELGNRLDDELNNLPLEEPSQDSLNPISSPNYNNGNLGTGDPLTRNLNFTGMM